MECVDRGEGAELDAFVGRDEVVDRLADRLDKLTEGRAQLVLVSGPAGIGKTRLTMECARRAHATGAGPCRPIRCPHP
jgi:predicted ATPase